MSAYFLTGEISRVTTGGSSLVCIIGTGANEEAAVEWYQKWLSEGYLDDTGTMVINDIATTPVFNQLITENGCVPLDWKALADSQVTPEDSVPDDFDAGFWLNTQALVPAENLPNNFEDLRNSIPAADAAELNWNPEKTHLFVIKAFQERIELIVLARARNALTAAWSWRHFGWETAVSKHPLVVEPCCQIVPIVVS